MKELRWVIIAIISFFSGCQTINTSSNVPTFRHPLFQMNDFSARNEPRGEFNVAPPAAKTIERCDVNYRNAALNRCESWPVASVDKQIPPQHEIDPALVQHRLDLAARARTLLKNDSFVVGNKKFPKDCSGLVMAVYAAENTPLDEMIKDVRPGEGNVSAIYRSAVKNKLIHKHHVPEIGDLIFFDNTWDRNKDGLANDPLTHIGIVERVDPDGTVSFIHHSRGGALRYKMNLFSPDMRRDLKTNKVFNQYLRFSKHSDGSARLTGELFNSFATIVR